MSIALQEVVDTYVLGGTRTDLQREAMTAKLVGSVVVWRFKVYDIAKEDGRYRVMSELMNGTEPGAFGKFTVVAFVTPKDEQDVQALLKLQTGNEVEIRGRVDGVTMRTALVLSPAELVRRPGSGFCHAGHQCIHLVPPHFAWNFVQSQQ
jgi:hypothetical protein